MRRIMLPLALIELVLVGLAPAAGADATSRPLRAVLSGTVTIAPDTTGECTAEPYMRTDSEAAGTVTHLGITTMNSTHCAAQVYAGTGTLVAANGDQIFYEYEGTGPLPTTIGAVYETDSEYEIVGGTGRFVAASGEGHLNVFFQFEGPGVPWPTTFVLDGTIGY